MWKKQGLIYKCDFFGTGYTQDPFIDKVSDDIWRIYFTARTKDVISLPFYIEVEAHNPKNVISVKNEPLFNPGRLGTFDETGITITSIVNVGNEKYMYYCGWNRRSSVPYALSIGVVIVKNNGTKFDKIFEGPIMDRSITNPISVSAPMVLIDEGIFKMWYISFTEWVIIDGRKEPVFVIKYATSEDGINWITDEKICINSNYFGESLARPWVIKKNGIYHMWFSARGSKDYRKVGGQHYMIEYAKSTDGINWVRHGKDSTITLSEDGWDSEMLGYASVYDSGSELIMLYNGNYFGNTGFGFATMVL
jgi:hypothetical protein